jgi:hypothetical protein
VNIYTHHFSATCPRNKRQVAYALRIESREQIMVEDLQAFVEELTEGYHEGFADDLHARFGGTQTLEADHHGTHIRTVRP